MNEGAQPSSERILFIAPTNRDSITTRQILYQAGLEPRPCTTIHELCHEYATTGAGALLVTQEALLADPQRCLTDLLKKQPFWSDCPLIVLTPSGGETRQQLDALAAIGHMTLMKRPIQVSMLISALYAALRDRQRQYEVRDLLEAREKQAVALSEAADSAAAANRAKSEFLANMSHEIRTPMNVIIGLANLLSRANVSGEKRKEFIETLQLSAQSLLELINDLLDIAKIENESVQLERIPFRLKSVVDEVINIMAIRTQEKNVELVLEFDPKCEGEFVGDPARLKQILMNLVSNSVKFTEQGVVTLQVHMAHDAVGTDSIVVLDVMDTGIGIAPEKVSTIFDKFLQGDNSITRRYGGTGLGLAITKRLVNLMEGEISLVSEPGIGTAFTVKLPLPQTAAPAQTKPVYAKGPNEYKSAAPDGAPLILLVEDYEANVLVATSMIEQFGYRYEVARNGSEAVNKFDEQIFDAILMDVQMPIMDGYSATRLIRQKEKDQGRARTPIIGITAYALVGDKEKCLGAGMDDYVAKPFRSEELQKKIEACVVKDKRGYAGAAHATG